jgi:uncharacterized damage-inducible protein DinB
MNAIDLIYRLHQHRAWVNEELLAAAEQLSADQLRQSFPIGQGSIWKSLLHLYAADFVWLEALQGNESGVAPGDLPGQLPGNQQGPNPISSPQELKSKWSDLTQRWSTYLRQLGPETLDDIVYRISTSSGFGKRHGTRRVDILLHLCTHAQYTTAQVVNMLRHCGAKNLPDVMLITLARQEAAEQANQKL